MDEKRYLLHELRLQNDKELDEKRNLDSKSSGISNYSVTFTVLLFGFGSFLLEKIQTTFDILLIFIISLLIAGVILSIICVIYSLIASRLQLYRYVMSPKNFFTTENLPKDIEKWKDYLDKKEIGAWIDDFKSQQDYEDFMIKEHLLALRRNTSTNDNKSKLIKKAYVFFFLAVCIIPVILIFILAGTHFGLIIIGK